MSKLHCNVMEISFSCTLNEVTAGGTTARPWAMISLFWQKVETAAWGCSQLVEHRTGKLSMQVRFLGAVRDFSPRVNFQCRLSYGVRTPPCAIASIYNCAHVEDPVIPVRVRWTMESLKHPACTLGWVARLCRSWLSPGKATRISYGINPIGTIQL